MCVKQGENFKLRCSTCIKNILLHTSLSTRELRKTSPVYIPEQTHWVENLIAGVSVFCIFESRYAFFVLSMWNWKGFNYIISWQSYLKEILKCLCQVQTTQHVMKTHKVLLEMKSERKWTSDKKKSTGKEKDIVKDWIGAYGQHRLSDRGSSNRHMISTILHYHCRGLEATRPTSGQKKYLYMLNNVKF